jgi:hypothetical protein
MLVSEAASTSPHAVHLSVSVWINELHAFLLIISDFQDFCPKLFHEKVPLFQTCAA